MRTRERGGEIERAEGDVMGERLGVEVDG